MKSYIRSFFLLALCVACLYTKPVTAQKTQTLISTNVRHGGFGGPVVKFGDLDDKLAVWVGGRGGWIINVDNRHSISLGGGGYGLVTEHIVPIQLQNAGSIELAAIGYGGFEIEYTYRPYRLVHWSLSSLIGGGGFTVREKNNHSSVSTDPKAFFALEPGFHAIVNITRYMRGSLGASYLFTSGADHRGFTDSDISGFKVSASVRFGYF